MAFDTTDIPAPQQSSARAPQDFELYRHISQEDAMPVVKKKHKSVIMEMLVGVMRIILYFDSLRRTHEVLFRRLNILWGFFVGVLYISGILLVIFSFYNRLKLPLYLEEQLKIRNIQFESAEYDMDRIEVRQLKGPDGLYTIDTLIAHTTFKDLLQKRIRSVVLDGVNIYLDAQSNFDPVQGIPALLTQLQHPAQGDVDLTINALTVNNAKLNFRKGQMALPISFSMEGVYEDKTQIIIPLSLDRPNLKMQGTLTIAETSNRPEWILKVTKGNVSLPRRAPEDFVGEVKVTLEDKKLDSIFANISLGTGTIKKVINANFSHQNGKGLTGTVAWNRNNLTEPALSSDLLFHFSHLSFGDNGPVQTRGTLTIESKKFNLYNVSFKNLHVPLNAEINCKSWTKCDLDLMQEASVIVPLFQFESSNQKISTQDALRFSLMPKKRMISMDAEQSDFSLTFDFPIQNVVFSGEDEKMDDDLDIKSKRLFISAVWADESRVAVLADGLDYDGAMAGFKNAKLNIADLLQNTSQIKLQAQSMQLYGQPLMSQPFDLTFNMIGQKASAQVKFNQLPIQADLEGQFSLLQKNFIGQVTIPTFELKDLPVPLSELWPSIPATVKNPKGKVAIKGQLNWSGGHASGNPLYVGLKDVSFNFGGVQIEGVNTVLTTEALSPMTTKPNQHIFIQQINGLVPLQNTEVQFQLDNQGLKINQLVASLASVPVVAPPVTMTSKSNSLVLYFKNNQPVNLPQVQQALNWPEVKIMGGNASVAIPVEIKDGSIAVSGVTMKLQDVQLQRQGNAYPEVFGTEMGYFVRNGQIVLTPDKLLQLSLNGRLLPSKSIKEVQLNKVALPKDFIKKLPFKDIPKDILERQKVLFEEGARVSQ